ncbi:ComEA family DNA-binding protein [Galliscardovia ingluviei]|uniref:ComEA family DNA-binding protein n=1 Tax=Galliscardovia ingluviei TaxID=1769422 RepID=UPI00166709FF|nr:ComEA family DNA-binding protein [Galliscardovia ingluviei]
MQQRNRALLAHRSIVPYRRLQTLADCYTDKLHISNVEPQCSNPELQSAFTDSYREELESEHSTFTAENVANSAADAANVLIQQSLINKPALQDHERAQTEQLEQIGEDSLLGMLSGVKASDTEPATDLQNDLISPRGRMRLSLEPQHAVLLIIILMCALSLSVTLSVRQGIVLVRQAQHQEQLLAQHTVQDADNTGAHDPDGKDATDGTDDINTHVNTQQSVDSAHQNQNTQDRTEQVPESPSQQIAPAPQQQSTININTATAEQLQQLKGIGPTMAQRIIDYRNKHGHFSSIDELQQVKGIGVKTLAKIRDDISVGDAP